MHRPSSQHTQKLVSKDAPIDLIHHTVAQAAERGPERVAFRFQGDSQTFGDLRRDAAKLAQCLADQGVGRGDRVGIYMRKSLRLPVALYGILWAGAAYVPLDPSAPPARTAAVLARCGIRHIVSDPAMEPALARIDLVQARVTHLMGAEAHGVESLDWSALATAAEAPAAQVLPDDIAYVMFTSGSTGTPKGITHTHGSGMAFARAAVATYEVTPDDCLANHSPLHFDMSTFEMFGGPLAGARVILIPEPVTRFPAELTALLEAEAATFWYSVPTAMIQMLERGALEARDLSAIRWVLYGGEPFAPKHLRALMAAWPQARVSNVYGPAEVNQCTFHNLDSPPQGDDPVPIGRMWPAAEGLILDEAGAPVPPGTPGELFVRSATRMRGYWNAPELTEQAFYRREVTPGIDDTFLRSGDIVVADETGVMTYLGRRDRMVKVRGYRVELDEVEAALSQHEDVAEAGAVATDENVLAAVTLRPGASAEPPALLAAARALLPPYAVPSLVRILDDMPRTGTGKIDRPTLKAQLLTEGTP